jgi:hypothetical protein
VFENSTSESANKLFCLLLFCADNGSLVPESRLVNLVCWLSNCQTNKLKKTTMATRMLRYIIYWCDVTSFITYKHTHTHAQIKVRLVYKIKLDLRFPIFYFEFKCYILYSITLTIFTAVEMGCSVSHEMHDWGAQAKHANCISL